MQKAPKKKSVFIFNFSEVHLESPRTLDNHDDSGKSWRSPRANGKTISRLSRSRSVSTVPAQFQTLAEVAYTFESLRRLCGRSEPAQPIPRSNTGAAFGGKGALQFRRAIVTGVDFPTRRYHIRSTTGGQELVRGRIQRDDRTVPLQLRRGNSLPVRPASKLFAQKVKIGCLCVVILLIPMSSFDADSTVRRYHANDTEESTRGTGASQIQLRRSDQS